MIKRTAIGVLCLTACISGVLAFESRAYLASKVLGFVNSYESQPTTGRSDETITSPAPKLQELKSVRASQTSDVPEYMLYEQTFRLVSKFKKEGEEQAAKGEQITPLAEYFRNEAELDDEQSIILNQTAGRFVEEISEIDTQAHSIVEKVRARIPKNRKTINKKFLDPPADLRQLQEKRENLAFQYRDYLRGSLKTEDFTKFQTVVQQTIRNSMAARPAGSAPVVDDRSKLMRDAGSTAPPNESGGCSGWIFGLAIVGYNNEITPRYVEGFNLTARRLLRRNLL